VKNLGCGLFQQVFQKTPVSVGIAVDKVAVGLAHQLDGLFGGGHNALRHQRLHAGDHRGLDRQCHTLHTGDVIGRGLAFGFAAKVQAVLHAQGLQLALVLRRETSQMVRAEHMAAAHTLAAGCGITAQIAEVGSALQQGIRYRGHDFNSLERDRYCRAWCRVRLLLQVTWPRQIGGARITAVRPVKIPSSPRSVAARRRQGAAGQAWGLQFLIVLHNDAHL